MTIWLAAGAVIALALVALLRVPSQDEVTLPPVRETKLTTAAAKARCTFTHATAGQRLTPAVDGRAAAQSARPGVYAKSPVEASLIEALRRGIIVIYVRPGVAADDRDTLSDLQKALPEGTIVTTGRTDQAFEVTATAYRRLLGCPGLTARTLDAVRLFRGRFVGRGPDT